jgi:hypothetical protein
MNTETEQLVSTSHKYFLPQRSVPCPQGAGTNTLVFTRPTNRLAGLAWKFVGEH